MTQRSPLAAHYTKPNRNMASQRPLFTPKQLEDYITKNPDADLTMLANHFGCSHATMRRAISGNKLQAIWRGGMIATAGGRAIQLLEKNPDITDEEILKETGIPIERIYYYRRKARSAPNAQ